jgi:hypothetical protein
MAGPMDYSAMVRQLMDAAYYQGANIGPIIQQLPPEAQAEMQRQMTMHAQTYDQSGTPNKEIMSRTLDQNFGANRTRPWAK